MGLHFLGELRFHLGMLDFQPLVHPALWRYLKIYAYCGVFAQQHFVIMLVDRCLILFADPKGQ